METLRHPARTLGYAVSFVGGVAGSLIPALFLGAGLLAILTVWFFRKPTNDLIRSLILLLLGTTAMAAVTRSGFGMEQSLSSRYTIYSLLACSVAYAIIVLPVGFGF